MISHLSPTQAYTPTKFSATAPRPHSRQSPAENTRTEVHFQGRTQKPLGLCIAGFLAAASLLGCSAESGSSFNPEHNQTTTSVDRPAGPTNPVAEGQIILDGNPVNLDSIQLAYVKKVGDAYVSIPKEEVVYQQAYPSASPADLYEVFRGDLTDTDIIHFSPRDTFGCVASAKAAQQAVDSAYADLVKNDNPEVFLSNQKSLFASPSSQNAPPASKASSQSLGSDGPKASNEGDSSSDDRQKLQSSSHKLESDSHKLESDSFKFADDKLPRASNKTPAFPGQRQLKKGEIFLDGKPVSLCEQPSGSMVGRIGGKAYIDMLGDQRKAVNPADAYYLNDGVLDPIYPEYH